MPQIWWRADGSPMVARKGSKVEVAGYSTGVINEPHPLLLLFFTYRLIAPPVPAFAVSAWRSAHLFQLPCDMMRRAAARARRTWKRARAHQAERSARQGPGHRLARAAQRSESTWDKIWHAALLLHGKIAMNQSNQYRFAMVGIGRALSPGWDAANS